MAYDEDLANRIRELIAGDPDVADVTDIDPGKRSTPPHSHADEDEAFLVLAGSGLSYRTSGSEDVRTYPIGVDRPATCRADQAVLARPALVAR